MHLNQFMRTLEEYQNKNFVRTKIVEESDNSKASANYYAGLFIEKLWIDIKSWVDNNPESLGLAEKIDDKLQPYNEKALKHSILKIKAKNPLFPFSKFRAITTLVTDFFLEKIIENSCPLTLQKYKKSLKTAGIHWYRESPKEHLWTGMHTALSAHFKMAQEVLEADNNFNNFFLHYTEAFKLIRYVASTHMDILKAVEGIIWDHAASQLGNSFEVLEGRFCIKDEAVKKIMGKLDSNEKSLEARTGCPAMYSGDMGDAVISEIGEWCINIIRKFY